MSASITERLRELQGSRSAEEFGNAVGVSRQTINYWLNGTRTPSAENIKTICEKEKCNANWLLGFDDAPQTLNTDIQMIAKYTGLSEESIEALGYMRLANIGTPVAITGKKTINFINRALKDFYLEAELDGIQYDPEKRSFSGAFNLMRDTFCSLAKPIFSHLEDWVTGSQDPDFIEVNNGTIRKDDVFREIAFTEIKRCLERYSNADGTFFETYKESNKILDQKNKEYWDSWKESPIATLTDLLHREESDNSEEKDEE